MILIDTQALLWLGVSQSPLGEAACTAIETSDERCCSAISFWEIAMLVDKRRISLSLPLKDWGESIMAGGLTIIDIGPIIALEAGSLPGDIHGDPSDRIIIATARAFSCPLVTSDRLVLRYAAQGHLQAIDARR